MRTFWKNSEYFQGHKKLHFNTYALPGHTPFLVPIACFTSSRRGKLRQRETHRGRREQNPVRDKGQVCFHG